VSDDAPRPVDRGDAEARSAAGAALVAGLAHDLRNVLASADTSLYLAQRAKTPEDRAAREVDARAHVRTAQDLVTRAIRATRGDALASETVDLAALVATATHEVATDPAVRLAVDVAAGLTVPGDPVLLARALENLVRNARDVARAAGRPVVEVRVEGRVVDREVVIRVEDDGPGIDPSVRPRLFQALATARPGGTGLGLRFVRAIAELHGGACVAEDPAAGAAFVLRLPARDRQAAGGT
jgi:signal transduction histidine kinase